MMTSTRILAAMSLSAWELIVSPNMNIRGGDIPREGLNVEIEVEVESDIDPEIFTTFVKSADDGVEAGLDFDLGGSGGDLLDRVLVVSGALARVVERMGETTVREGEEFNSRWKS